MHNDRRARGLLPWFEGVLKATDAAYYKTHSKPVYSSHIPRLLEDPAGIGTSARTSSISTTWHFVA
ncbi:hypothetical protein BDN67DRAFT_967348 [Paxillus ammoniavirescens]|nr:hypothetical protein BDN67DRAFT_967348 [Paxillus ammoniavirescens]